MSEQRSPHIASVGKALAVLSIVAERNEQPSAKDIAAAMGAPLPSTYHLLNTLVTEGALVKEGSRGGYRFGPRIGLLADAYLEQGEPLARLEGPLRELADRTGESTYLSAWRRGEIEVIITAEGSHAVRVGQLRRGTHGSAHARASGKLLLANARRGLREEYLRDHALERRTPHTICDPRELEAEFRRIRDQGYATDREEFFLDVCCVAAPIVSSGHIVGAYTVSSPSSRFDRNRDELVEVLLDVCQKAQALITGSE